MGSIEAARISGFLCRLCSEMHRTVIHVYGDKGVDLNLAHKINSYLPVTISPNDPLPKTICESCLKRVEQHHQLMLRVKKNKKPSGGEIIITPDPLSNEIRIQLNFISHGTRIRRSTSSLPRSRTPTNRQRQRATERQNEQPPPRPRRRNMSSSGAEPTINNPQESQNHSSDETIILSD